MVECYTLLHAGLKCICINIAFQKFRHAKAGRYPAALHRAGLPKASSPALYPSPQLSQATSEFISCLGVGEMGLRGRKRKPLGQSFLKGEIWFTFYLSAE